MIFRNSGILALFLVLSTGALAQEDGPPAMDMSSPEVQEIFRQQAARAVALAAEREAMVAENAKRTPYSPTVGSNVPRQVLWGDTHVHTQNSPDAFTFGNTTLSPADAYKFAQGSEIDAHNGQKVKLRRPLDFLMVSDHAEYIGLFPRLVAGDEDMLATELGARWGGYISSGNFGLAMVEFVAAVSGQGNPIQLPHHAKQIIWNDIADLADQHNQPGKFTALIGYEWTSQVNSNNLHRVVIFRDNADTAKKIVPFSALDSNDPEDLWQFLADYENDHGGQVLAIAHNGNISNGMMFASETLSGEPLTRDYADRRARWEPVYEVTQVKGDGEAHPTLSPTDEFADYETWDADNIGRTQAKEDWMLRHEYARGALKYGLELEKRLGGNPYKFGMIGSTDSHTAFATAEEENFFGKFPDSEPLPARATNNMGNALWKNWRLASSGYAGVWATENTREAIYDAMQRREVYGTTGSRITVRLFAGWDYTTADITRPDFVDIGYAKGVPMGGDLTRAPEGEAPSLMVFAAKDPDGANLDRIQVIKGWLDADGNSHEKIYDVALSPHRKVDPETGKAPLVGNTVDVADASYTNTIGGVQLSAVWQDPDFDAATRAFYYVRVLEIPTPRWTAYDAKYFGIEMDEEVPMVQQDRAYTSPIWYTP
jgi:hypothetical protein